MLLVLAVASLAVSVPALAASTPRLAHAGPAPRLRAHGKTLKWALPGRHGGRHRVYKLSVKARGRRWVLTVRGRSFTPRGVAGARVVYRVRLARHKTPWSNPVAIRYPRRHGGTATAVNLSPQAGSSPAQAGLESTGASATWHGYSASNPMPGGIVPYAPSSPFNQPVPSSPAVLANSSAMVSFLLGQGSPSPSTMVTGGAYGHPIYYSRSDDPIVEIHLTQSWGANPLKGRRVPVPPQAVPAPGSDGHMGIVLPDGEEIDLWQAQAPKEGKLYAAWGSRSSITGNGLGGQATASGFDLFAGVIRGPELRAGVIPHALFAVSAQVKSSFVYPAARSDSGGGAADAPAEGQRFYLAYSDAEIAALPIPGWRKAIVTALAHYGMYIGDSGGSGLGLQFESSVMYTAFGVGDPFVSLAQENGLPKFGGSYSFDVSSGIDWSRLRAIGPPS